jgi:hypothetical protein
MEVMIDPELCMSGIPIGVIKKRDIAECTDEQERDARQCIIVYRTLLVDIASHAQLIR